ncbi:MAG: hypothetical protein ACK5LR_02835 [Mangrovibacterium sp.]
MQLNTLSNNKWKPITLAAVFLSAATPLSYQDLDAHSGILTTVSDCKTSNYLNTVDKSDQTVFIQKFRFDNHYAKWQEKTVFLSSVSSIIEDEDFKAIVSMGQSAVLYIVERIEVEPSPLVWALNFIYGKKITSQNATIIDACKLWVKELRK